MAATHLITCPSDILATSTFCKLPRSIVEATALLLALIVKLSVPAEVLNVIPAPATKVNVSSGPSALILVCPSTAICLNAKSTLPLPPPLPPDIATKSTFWILPYASTVICGVVVALPYVPAVTPVATKFKEAFEFTPLPLTTVI